MIKKEYKIEGMSCHHCVMAIEMGLNQIGVNSHKVEIGSAIIEYDENKLSDEKVKEAIEEAGYKVIN